MNQRHIHIMLAIAAAALILVALIAPAPEYVDINPAIHQHQGVNE